MTDALALVDDWGPEKIVVVSHRRSGMKGVLVIDNTARGIGKGGTRMSPGVSVGEIARLARVMTWKWASVDLFYGGAKAGIVADPNSPDKEAVLRAFARALSNEVPREYVMGLDMGLTENDAAIIQDELGDRGAAVGTPEHLGGVAYDKLGVTGFGVAEATDAAAQSLGLPTAGSRVAIQGFGAVGNAAAARFAELGATVVAVSTAKGALHDPSGLDVPTLLAAREEYGDDFVNHYEGARIGAGQELTVDCDILVPAALQDVVDDETAHRIKAKLVVEGANLPTSPRAQSILARSAASRCFPTSSPTRAVSSPPHSPWMPATPDSGPTPPPFSRPSPPGCAPMPSPSSTRRSAAAPPPTPQAAASPRSASAPPCAARDAYPSEPQLSQRSRRRVARAWRSSGSHASDDAVRCRIRRAGAWRGRRPAGRAGRRGPSAPPTPPGGRGR